LKRALATDQTEFGCDPKLLHCFVLNEDKSLYWFAGIWTSWYSVRRKKEGPVQADIFAFLTTEANAAVKPIHEQAMPVILTTAEEIEVWMNAPAEEALQLQRPLPDQKLIVLPQPKAEEEEPLLI
jgi:putative SOS response-associated peptidase YedK